MKLIKKYSNKIFILNSSYIRSFTPAPWYCNYPPKLVVSKVGYFSICDSVVGNTKYRDLNEKFLIGKINKYSNKEEFSATLFKVYKKLMSLVECTHCDFLFECGGGCKLAEKFYGCSEKTRKYKIELIKLVSKIYPRVISVN